MKLYKNYIDGKWLESEAKEIIQVDDPATGKVIGEISCAKKNEVTIWKREKQKSWIFD